jgi:hypothetical protein
MKKHYICKLEDQFFGLFFGFTINRQTVWQVMAWYLFDDYLSENKLTMDYFLLL